VESADLFERISRRLDLDPSEYLTDEEIGQDCEEAYLELWDIMIAAMGEESPWELLTLSTVANQAYIDVPASSNVYRMGRLDFRGSSEAYEPLLRFNMASDPMHSTARAWGGAGSARYFARRAFRSSLADRSTFTGRHFAWKVYFDPIPSGVHSVRLFYVPGPGITLTHAAGVTTYTTFPDEWPEYVVNAVCVKKRIKEESDPTEFERERDRQAALIERYCKPHQLNSPQFMADHRRLQSPSGDAAAESFWRR